MLPPPWYKPVDAIPLTITLGELAAWLAALGASIKITFQIGEYRVTITQQTIRRLDECDEHHETWILSRFDADLGVALAAALAAAQAIHPTPGA